VLTGLVNIADYLVASIERSVCNNGSRKGFVYTILNRNEIEIVKNIVIKCESFNPLIYFIYLFGEIYVPKYFDLILFLYLVFNIMYYSVFGY